MLNLLKGTDEIQREITEQVLLLSLNLLSNSFHQNENRT